MLGTVTLTAIPVLPNGEAATAARERQEAARLGARIVLAGEPGYPATGSQPPAGDQGGQPTQPHPEPEQVQARIDQDDASALSSPIFFTFSQGKSPDWSSRARNSSAGSAEYSRTVGRASRRTPASGVKP